MRIGASPSPTGLVVSAPDAASGPQFVRMFPNPRQDILFDTRTAYFSNNPLRLWRLGFVKWVDVRNTHFCLEPPGRHTDR